MLIEFAFEYYLHDEDLFKLREEFGDSMISHATREGRSFLRLEVESETDGLDRIRSLGLSQSVVETERVDS